MDDKKAYLIDVPVLLIFFSRPGCFAQVFEQVKKARPSKLFLYQDGPREGNQKDIEGIRKCREIAENIDWNCEVHKLYQEKNVGCDPSGYLARKWAFETVTCCIILEDDCVPSQSFFPFCKELLDRYENDQRVNMICGMNNLETWESPYSYLFTNTGSIWGVATWKRVFDEWDSNYSLLEDKYNREKLNNSMSVDGSKMKGRWKTWDADKVSGIAHHEALGGICQFAESRMNIVPTKNMIVNNGNTTEGGTHSTNSNNTIPKGLRKIYTMPSYEIEFPLKHPKYMINDVDYQRRLYRLMGSGHSMVQFWRKIEKSFLIFKYEGFGNLAKKIMSR